MPLLSLLPGLLLCAAISALAHALGTVWPGGPGGLALAILAGAALGSLWRPGPFWQPGIRAAAKPVLEFAVMLLGAALDPAALLAQGWIFMAAAAALVTFGVVGGYRIGRFCGLDGQTAWLVAGGTAICGNSAIAAIAPAIAARPSQIGGAIAFTAFAGIAVVLALPDLARTLDLSAEQAGMLAGLGVYAVPQVLAAAAPFGPAAVALGTLVKLMRVALLAPLVMILAARFAARGDGRRQALRPPWFLLGFIALAALRGAELLPAPLPLAAQRGAGLLAVLAMAALGLGVDLRQLARGGARLAAAAIGSVLWVLALAYGLVRICLPQ